MTLEFRWHYWVTDNPEWIYYAAIINGNVSCIEAWEKWRRRQPFRGNDVSVTRWESDDSPGGYLHTHGISRKRERLAEGFGLPLHGLQWWVTGFDDANGLIRLANYGGPWPRGKPKKVMKLTHEELAALCPAPKKKTGDGGEITA
jgi:hypothetical protein